VRNETRPWGRFEVLYEDEQTWLKRIIIAPGQSLSYQYHNWRTETWVAENAGVRAVVEGRDFAIRYPSNTPTFVPRRAKHRLYNPCDHESSVLEWCIAVEHGPLSEDDIVRLADNYGR